MKKLIITSITLSIFAISSNVHADGSAQTQVEVKGIVQSTCNIVNPDNSAFDYEELSKPSGLLNTSNVLDPRPLGNITCNGPASLSIKSTNGAMKIGGGACNSTGSTTNCVFYNALANWDGLEVSLAATGTPSVATSTTQTAGATTSDLTLKLELTGPTDKTLLTGSYSDLLVVKVGGLF